MLYWKSSSSPVSHLFCVDEDNGRIHRNAWLKMTIGHGCTGPFLRMHRHGHCRPGCTACGTPRRRRARRTPPRCRAGPPPGHSVSIAHTRPRSAAADEWPRARARVLLFWVWVWAAASIVRDLDAGQVDAPGSRPAAAPGEQAVGCRHPAQIFTPAYSHR